MRNKRYLFIKLFILTGTILMIGILWSAVPATAQCGDIPRQSGCITCHETTAPLSANDIWHSVHARKDCCVNCHGGNWQSMDAAQAHEAMTANPLADIYTSCHACHPDDYEARAAVFAQMIGVTPGSRATPTPLPAIVLEEHPMVIQPATSIQSGLLLPAGIILGGLVFIVVFTLLIWTWRLGESPEGKSG